MTVTMVVTEPITVARMSEGPWPLVVRTGGLSVILSVDDAEGLIQSLEAAVREMDTDPLPVFTPELVSL